jgi:hypothetical protein
LWPKLIHKIVSRRLNAKDGEAWPDVTPNNAKMHQWFVGKCLQHKNWCS